MLALRVLALLAASCLAAPAWAGPPAEPLVLKGLPEIGRPGGDLRTLISRSRDVRLLSVYGHARLVGYDRELRMEPDILAAYEVEEGRVFTFHLRRGHGWSDGTPFTTEDFRFFWDDVAQNPALSPVGPEIQLVVDGELPKVEIVDQHTIRYSWSKPNPFFLPAVAAAVPLFIYRPAHYLKQFHERYAEPGELARLIKETESRDWVQLFLRKDRMDKFDNPDQPTLEPWRLVTAPPAERFIAERNPSFHRVDANGQQLPYLDRVILDVVASDLIPVKTGAGETDLQARALFFKDYTFLKESEARSGLRTLLWPEARGAHLALYPNLNAADLAWRGLFRDRRFREALSLGIDRTAISQFMYFGLATPANNTLVPESPLYREDYATPCTAFDAEQANTVLDELGLDKRNGAGVRLLPDGRPMELVVETAGEESEQTDVLELIRDQWAAIGFKIHTKPSERDVLRNRIFSGEALMSIFYGIDNGAPTAQMPPKDYAPTNQAEQPQWPKWGQYYETKGAAGEAPELPEAKRLMELYTQWQGATALEDKERIWHDILATYAPQCFTLGLVADVRQPIAVRAGLRNLPEEAVFNWEPHGQIGLYRPDTFWYAK